MRPLPRRGRAVGSRGRLLSWPAARYRAAVAGTRVCPGGELDLESGDCSESFDDEGKASLARYVGM